MTKQQLLDARFWLSECFSAEAEDIAEASDAEIETAIEKHFSGGIEEFTK